MTFQCGNLERIIFSLPWDAISALSTAGAVFVSLFLACREIMIRRQTKLQKSALAEAAIKGDLENILPLISQVYGLIRASEQQPSSDDKLTKAKEKIQENGLMMQTTSMDKTIDCMISLTKPQQEAAFGIWATIPALSRRCANADTKHIGSTMFNYRDAMSESMRDIKKIVRHAAIFIGKDHPLMHGVAGLADMSKKQGAKSHD